MDAQALRAGDEFPGFSWPLAQGGELTPARRNGWRLLVVYRGKHCGLCRKYLAQLNAMHARFTRAEVDLFAISADPRERAQAQVAESQLAFPVGYGLEVEQMRALGLYVSPGDHGKVEWPFAEPALFVINAEGKVHVANVSNAPFARPEPAVLLEGIEAARKDAAPIHGTLSRP
jgi:peroxiredoxin